MNGKSQLLRTCDSLPGKPLVDLSDFSKRNALDTVVSYCTVQQNRQLLCIKYTMVERPQAALRPLVLTVCLLLVPTTSNSAVAMTAVGIATNQLKNCGSRLENGYCYTLGTASSIQVGDASA